MCNYTGDLRHSEEGALADFALLTGREQPADCEVVDRATLERFGADILLTNFKMLEYALVRRRDARLFTPLGERTDDGAEGRLSYLVLDELHTYSGRQGADMALLVRRFRQRTATMGRLRCIATSATLDTTDLGVAAATIASFATGLFGEVFDAAHVVAEVHGEPVCLDPADPGTFLASQPIDPALAALAGEATSEEEALELLGPALCGTTGAPDPAAVKATRPVAWIERALWDGVRSLPELAEAYGAEVRPGLELSRAADEVEAAFVLASMTKVDGPRGTPVGLLTPKVHAFFSQGLPVTGCLRTDPPHLSEVGSGTCLACAEQGAAGVTAYPMVFCAACGQEFFVAVRRPRGPWESRPFQAPTDDGTPVYLMAGEWDEDFVPVDPAYVKVNGEPRKGREGAVPARVVVCGTCGELGAGCGHANERELVEVAEPLLLCPACGIVYDGTYSEYNKFFQVGTVGRSTATDVLVSGLLDRLDPDERQVMAFADNQQDTSFQAAHLNSLGRRFHLRRSIVAGLRERGAISSAAGLDATEVGSAAYEAMVLAGQVPPYTRQSELKALDPDATLNQAKGTYLRYLRAGVLMECSGNPRKTQPTLEDTGLLAIDYAGFANPSLLAERASEIPRLASLDPDLRVDLLRAILDQVRRARSISSQADKGPAAVFTNGPGFTGDVVDRMNPTALFHSGMEAPRRVTVFSDVAESGHIVAVHRLAGRDDPTKKGAGPTTTLCRWLMAEADLHAAQAKDTIRAGAGWLADYGFLVKGTGAASGGVLVAEEQLRFWLIDAERPPGERCPRCAVRHFFQRPGRRCPRCVKVILGPDPAGRLDFFRNEYRRPIESAVPIAAEEHSAAVPGDERKQIEKRFRDGNLNVIVCTPTMELGVDIGNLSAIYLRNVPPSPANYAQRQGRAGRAAQPSIVVTFCGAQGRYGVHDQYFFRFPEKIVAGRIAPPRFLLDNEALVESHLHSIVLGARGADLPSEIDTWVELDPAGPLGLIPAMRESLTSFVTAGRGELIAAGRAVLDGILGTESVPEDIVERVVDGFVEDFNTEWAAFGAEMAALDAELDRLNAKAKATGLDASEDRRRRAAEGQMKDMRSGSGDFYPLAWLAQRGFLPTYAFPRRPVLLRFDDQKNARARSRAIALREFAPLNHVYNRGRRYEVVRAGLGGGPGGAWQTVALCPGCGRYYTAEDAETISICRGCGRPIEERSRHRSALSLPDAYAVSRDRVTADTEERLRLGYLVDAYVKLPAVGIERYRAEQAVNLELSYVHHGHVLQVNAGFRGRKDQRGFRLCSRCGRWEPEAEHYNTGRPCAGASEQLVKGVVLTTEGRHDLFVIDVQAPVEVVDGARSLERFGWTLLYALRAGVATRFGLDESEIDGQVFTHPFLPETGARLVLFESDEGGIGVLRQLADADHFVEVCARTLEVLHVQPDGSEEADACDSSCYECLRSFYNQWHHDLLDRRLVIPLVGLLAAGVELAAVAQQRSWDELLGAESAASHTEAAMIESIIDSGVPPPSALHHVIFDGDVPLAEADLYYEADGTRVVVFLDGAVHHEGVQPTVDAVKTEKLKAKGYTVVRIDVSNQDEGIGSLRRKLKLDG